MLLMFRYFQVLRLSVAAEELSESKYQACGCLAQCDYIIYDLETTTADFDASRYVRRSF